MIMVAVPWYLRYGLSYRDVEAGGTGHHRGPRHGFPVSAALHIVVDRRGATVPSLRQMIAGLWRDVCAGRGARRLYLYRAIDQFGQVIDVLAAQKRDLAATRRFFIRALEHGPSRPTGE
jgi:IS6 family transposase